MTQRHVNEIQAEAISEFRLRQKAYLEEDQDPSRVYDELKILRIAEAGVELRGGGTSESSAQFSMFCEVAPSPSILY